MAIGPGVYDTITTMLLEGLHADLVLTIVGGGSRGDGSSLATTDRRYLSDLPRVLRELADEIERDNEALGKMGRG
jgi:hypothetical protein